MSDADFDLFVIGAGSGGVRAARMAAQRGARVAIAEASALGGTCVNLGCIPKKLYSYAAHYAEAFEEARGFGWGIGSSHFDWLKLKHNRAIEITRLNGVYQQLLEQSGVRIMLGKAKLTAPHAVAINGEVFSARYILIATGARSNLVPVPGHEHMISSDQMFDLEPFPQRLLVIGGGYIASEFASIFNGLGAKVIQAYRGEQILRGFDDDIRYFVSTEMCKTGLDLRVKTEVASIDKTDAGLNVRFKDGTVCVVDTILSATGRIPNIQGLGLEEVGVQCDANGAITVDTQYRTSVPSVFAIGDVIGRIQLTPVALAEAMTLVDQLFGDGTKKMDYALVPTAVFTHPNVAAVGMSEEQARATYEHISVFMSDFKPLRHTLSGSSERVLMKLIVEEQSDRVVGLHMVGPDSGEIVQGFAVAMMAGATKAVFDRTIGIHPTLAEEFVTMRTPVTKR